MNTDKNKPVVTTEETEENGIVTKSTTYDFDGVSVSVTAFLTEEGTFNVTECVAFNSTGNTGVGVIKARFESSSEMDGDSATIHHRTINNGMEIDVAQRNYINGMLTDAVSTSSTFDDSGVVMDTITITPETTYTTKFNYDDNKMITSTVTTDENGEVVHSVDVKNNDNSSTTTWTVFVDGKSEEFRRMVLTKHELDDNQVSEEIIEYLRPEYDNEPNASIYTKIITTPSYLIEDGKIARQNGLRTEINFRDNGEPTPRTASTTTDIYEEIEGDDIILYSVTQTNTLEGDGSITVEDGSPVKLETMKTFDA